VFLFSLSETNKRREDATSPGNEPVEAPPPDLSEGAQMVANRLRKNQKKLANWLQNGAVECYRIYDADMPEYSVAIDVYGEHIHVAEYAPPKTVKEDDANRRFEEILDAVQVVFDITDRSEVAVKRRQRQRGLKQYERVSRKNERIFCS
jgi:23S rRNA (guanine2445-N2)-methyltransferase / 23S rRNA (guanine2069-N7)-methyltransferase